MNNKTTKISSTSNGPRVRWRICARNQYVGDYKKHRVTVWRNSPKRPWFFQVTAPDGTQAADGQMREPSTQREAIVYALRGALLWDPPASA